MPRRRRPFFRSYTVPRLTKRRKFALVFALAFAALMIFYLPIAGYLSDLMSRYGISYVRDSLMTQIHDAITAEMSEGDYPYDYFVTLDKDAAGNITALKSNMAHINTLSSSLIGGIVDIATAGDFNIKIPFGNLTGVNILSGRGPMIPIKIVMLTSSTANFRNNFSSAGINQTKHEVMVEVSVDVDILVPWDTIRTTVVTEILVAETVVVGRVPDTYLEFGKQE